MSLTFTGRFAAAMESLLAAEAARISSAIAINVTASIEDIRLNQGRVDGYHRAIDMIRDAERMARGDAPEDKGNT